MKNKVDLVIIGAQKAGTTSLNKYLSQHPEIFTHFTLEFGMFENIQLYNKGIDFILKQTVLKQDLENTEKSMFVAKRVGLMYKPSFLEKLKEHNPDVKIVIVLRNPIERAYSAFWHCKNNGIEPLNNFEEAIYATSSARFNNNKKFESDCDYIGRSSYLNHIQNVYSLFPAENIKIFLFEEIMGDLNRYLNEMCQLIGLREYHFNTSIRYNERIQPRFSFLSRLISSKKLQLISNILPVKQRLQLKQKLKTANSMKEAKDKTGKQLNSDTRLYLLNIFKDEVKELEKSTRLPIRKYWPEFFNQV